MLKNELLEQRLFQEGQSLHLEISPVSGAAFQALDQRRLTDYLDRIIQEPVPPVSEAQWTERLARLGLMTETANSACVCTVAGLLLFGHSPRQYLRHAGVRWMAFEGPDRGSRAL